MAVGTTVFRGTFGANESIGSASDAARFITISLAKYSGNTIPADANITSAVLALSNFTVWSTGTHPGYLSINSTQLLSCAGGSFTPTSQGSGAYSIPLPNSEIFRNQTSLTLWMGAENKTKLPNYWCKVQGACVFTLTVAWEQQESYTSPTAPTSVSVDSATASPGAKVSLRWSGATAGTNNPILGYQILRADSASGSYAVLATVSSSAGSGSTTVTAPTTNGATYYYKIKTLGTVSGYDSAPSSAYAALQCTFASVYEPTNVQADATNVAPGASVAISWSGARAGDNNPITGYKVYRASTADGTYELLTSVSSGDTSGSVNVTAPSTNGAAYYYKVQTVGTIGGSDSTLSTAYATVTCTYSAPSAPGNLRIGASPDAYALPGASVLLEWDASADGANNPLTGYTVYRNGTVLASGISSDVHSYSVTAHGTAGQSYTYTVVATGAYSNSVESNACFLYSYSNPTAPSTVAVSNPNPPEGIRVTLSWSGAQAGQFNAISSYNIYRSATASGTYTLVGSAAADASSARVASPDTEGTTWYYKVSAVGAISESGLSAYVAVTAAAGGGGEEYTTEEVPPAIVKRTVRMGDYDTAADGGWTLTGMKLAMPETQTRFTDVPFRANGPIDQTTLLTDGDPRYGSRDLRLTFECSEGTRMEREAIISEMVNRLHGQRVKIVLPDDPDHYLVGRVAIGVDYNDPYHAAINVRCTCEPWRYSVIEHRMQLVVTEGWQTVILFNSGRKVLVPEITVTGYNASVVLVCNGQTWVLTEGTHRLARLTLHQGNTMLSYSGSGDVLLTYREAIL